MVMLCLTLLSIMATTVAAKGKPGGGGGLGSDIKLDCQLGASWGDGSADTIKDDALGWYEDGVDSVNCYIGGPSTPWPIRLQVGGGRKANVRNVDLILGGFDIGTFYQVVNGAQEGTAYLKDLYPKIFEPAANGNGMDAMRIGVRPYRGDPILQDPSQTTESIHLLPPGIYEMGMHFYIPNTGIDRFSISIASKHYEGNEAFTGIDCDSGYEAQILDHSPDGPMQDVSVYVWPDGDNDGLPDAYTVTTGVISFDELGFPKVEPGSRYAAVCSAVGPLVCGNPKAPSNCNFLGYVNMQFTLTAMTK